MVGYFDNALKKLDEAKKWAEEPGSADNLREEAGARADEVLDVARNMGSKIPGDIDDTLINMAKEIKEKLAGK